MIHNFDVVLTFAALVNRWDILKPNHRRADR
jgi:hypothetical protein